VEHDLIEAYLVELRHGLPGRADLDDVPAEVEDHLRLKASRLEAGGLDQLEAQHRALEVFGNPAVVARAFIASPDVPGAVPTRFTKFSGLVAIAAGLAWINLIGLIEFGLVTMLVSASTVRPFAIGAVALTVIALVGSVQRAGGFRNLVIRLVFTGAAIFALALAVPVWMGDAVLVSLLSAVSLLTILALRGSRTGQFGRGRAAMVFQGAWVPTIALSTLIVGWQLAVGPRRPRLDDRLRRSAVHHRRSSGHGWLEHVRRDVRCPGARHSSVRHRTDPAGADPLPRTDPRFRRDVDQRRRVMLVTTGSVARPQNRRCPIAE